MKILPGWTSKREIVGTIQTQSQYSAGPYRELAQQDVATISNLRGDNLKQMQKSVHRKEILHRVGRAAGWIGVGLATAGACMAAAAACPPLALVELGLVGLNTWNALSNHEKLQDDKRAEAALDRGQTAVVAQHNWQAGQAWQQQAAPQPWASSPSLPPPAPMEWQFGRS
ncbi:MAG TPA: hypothetical protein VGO93_06455 [Candidatus Xenobia bacterium]|jgi:hypothetical protein